VPRGHVEGRPGLGRGHAPLGDCRARGGSTLDPGPQPSDRRGQLEVAFLDVAAQPGQGRAQRGVLRLDRLDPGGGARRRPEAARRARRPAASSCASRRSLRRRTLGPLRWPVRSVPSVHPPTGGHLGTLGHGVSKVSRTPADTRDTRDTRPGRVQGLREHGSSHHRAHDDVPDDNEVKTTTEAAGRGSARLRRAVRRVRRPPCGL
jgi:hypothetical protein